MQDVGDARTAKFPTKLRRNYPRSRNGCLTCRHRRKKCDETRPQCVGCTRNKMSCVWPATAKQPEPSSSASASSASPAPTTDNSSVQYEAGRLSESSGGHKGCFRRDSTASPTNPSHPSNLALYQHKGRWQAYLPSLAAWEGVEGCSVNLNPAYDESGRRRDVAAAAAAGLGCGTAAEDDNIDDDVDSVQPLSSSHTDTGDTATTVDDDGDDDDTDDRMDEIDNQQDDEEDAVVAAWAPSVASFIVDAATTTSSSFSSSSPSVSSQKQQHRHRQQRRHRQEHRYQQRAVLPPRIPFQRPRVAAMTPLSSSMLRHYIVEAAPTLATNRAARNPFIAAILPLAYTDDLVMHCVLAIGGSHLSNRLTKPTSPGTTSAGNGDNGSAASAIPAAPNGQLVAYTAPDSVTAALYEATTRHYTSVLRSLRAALRDLQPADSTRVLRVLAVLLLLSTYECLSWNVLGGGVFAHLRASRQLIAWLREPATSSAATSPVQRLSSDDRSLLGALLEIYAYQVLANRICPDGSIAGRSAVGEDTGEHDDEDFVADPGLLADRDSFGLLFSGLHGLFALIPPMSRLAAAAVRPPLSAAAAEAASATAQPPPPPASRLSGIIGGAASSAPIATHVAALRNRALAWQLPAAFLAQATGDQDRIWQRAIGETYRQAVLVYLETIKSPVKSPADATSTSTSTSTDADTVQRHIQAFGEAVIGADLVASRFATILLWPLLIVGSILVHPDERNFLSEGLKASPQATWASIRAADVLGKLWARRDEARAGPNSAGDSTYYGPHGLAQIMRETNVNLCIG